MGLAGVSTILWRERRLLELLAFKLDAQQLLIGSGRDRWLHHATDELEDLLEELRHTELLRAVEVDAVAARSGLHANPSLSELADVSPAPFDELLREHRDALRELAAEVRDRSRQNHDALARGQAAVQDLLVAATAAAAGPAPRAGRRPGDVAASRGIVLDEAL